MLRSCAGVGSPIGCQLTGVAVAGAVVGHMVAYVLAVPEPTVRVALLGATGHAYWNAAIAAASVLGLASLTTTLERRFQGRQLWPAAPNRLSGWVVWPDSWPGSSSRSTWSRRPWSGWRGGHPLHALWDGRGCW